MEFKVGQKISEIDPKLPLKNSLVGISGATNERRRIMLGAGDITCEAYKELKDLLMSSDSSTIYYTDSGDESYELSVLDAGSAGFGIVKDGETIVSLNVLDPICEDAPEKTKFPLNAKLKKIIVIKPDLNKEAVMKAVKWGVAIGGIFLFAKYLRNRR